MYIVFETNDNINLLRQKYLVLELDTLEFSDGKTVKAHAVIDSEKVNLQEISILESLKNLHEKLIENYHKGNWKYCKDAIDHLTGKFKGEMDTFYVELGQRIADLEGADLTESWTGNVKVQDEQNTVS